LQRPVPTVVCDQPGSGAGVDRVGIDDRAATLGLARHLVGLGHRQIGVVCMRLSNVRRDEPVSVRRQQESTYPVQRNRLAGLRDGFAEAGVDWDDVPVLERFEHSADAGADAARHLLDRHRGLTAIICLSDILAMGALRHAAERGLNVPGDLTVTGFDGLAEADRVGLTTVRQPVREKGLIAGQLLIEHEQRSSPRHVKLPTELIVGVTSCPPRL
ncbi:MAG: transcriptional regulator, LacI family, partial [Pseudonocardia sp.]|nr:transcriptional regulator, LacI family [Pseudonocardia sp.]